ncbi:ABC-F family ATP-binding cassette domain-containing protein [Crocinitomicaceae bacterium CZZ-1]|uniref:ABC-F family ATP-binding cassette domain-containing protein n=1 Tax=Taishania pollutisoli TaxID=2766479 RepID=A0A8J6PJD9_9FLAO|nr:ABC-F family ATP-binding cassette domain-containing protein [Taishania pollutisoli]MBC9812734.1 ABC-F family ATP-binding cassette domain-containing protein [Taishania pollutisoli]NGF75960.1 ABC-F family ATP-binding cassette domain-containing protein [Fluviicola sp. SGL-29]
MNFLSVENITKSFGDRVIFQDITFGIDQGQKVAIVAKNGAGKTTLLRCLTGLDTLDEGRVVFRNDLRMVFMEQSEDLNPEHTILEEVFSHDLPELRAIKAYNKATSVNDEEAVQKAFEQISELNAWDVEVRVSQILSVLKLDHTDMQIQNLSGGQKKRVALAKVLIAEPDFLILDEPTNHLDLDMIEWLEDYLSKSKSTILMVTHDRYFLEVVCDTILELDNKTLYRYKGNFSYFLEKKAEREEQFESTVEKAKNQFRKELEWMRRQPKARGTKQKARIEAFHDTKKVAHQRLDKDELDIPVKMERLGTKILELHRLGKAFGEKKILNDFTYIFKRQERVGIVGNNGTGKSTFLNMILEKEPVDKGKIVVGETVVFGYYNQEQLVVEDDKKVIDVIRDVAEFIPLEKGRQLSAAHFLEKFLFPRDMHYNFVHKLSGGEKRRLKLMTVLMKNPNFLILDEPTNDLDIFVMAVLEEYLRSFEGCLIVVSHDRYFMDKMVDHLFVFEGKGEVKDIIGNYSEYRKQQKQVASAERQEEKKLAEETVVEAVEPAELKEKKKLSYKEQKEYESLEGEIEQLEAKKEELTVILSAADSSNEAIMKAGEELAKVVAELDDKTNRWLELSEFV